MDSPNSAAPIRLMLVEDSPAMRELLLYILATEPRIQVAGIAGDGEAAVDLAQRICPDVILMDIHLPKMDGFAATRKIMELCPTRVVVATATSIPNEIAATFQALESGALTVLAKPPGLMHADHRRLADELLLSIKLMSEVPVVKRWSQKTSLHNSNARLLATSNRSGIRVVAIGASTGGPLAIRDILNGIATPLHCPIMIVQHISRGFSDGFVEWLAQSTGYKVQLASQGQTAQGGIAYVAPDNQHMKLRADGMISLHATEFEHGMRPAVSTLFRSIAEEFGRQAVGMLLTGMGTDGAQELKLMRNAGAVTMAQNEQTSVVHGMPGEAIKVGAAEYICSPQDMAITLLRLIN